MSRTNEDEMGKPGPPYLGKPGPPYVGKPGPPYVGRDRKPGGAVFLGGSSREAGVVVRATVEAFGPVGDTELHVTVRWPAGNNIAAASQEEPVEDAEQPAGVDANADSDR